MKRAPGAFRMPAEYSRHLGTVMIWPERPGSWPYGAAEARKAFADVIRAVTRSEKAFVAVSPRGRASAEAALAGELTAGKAELWECETDDAWARDIGPTCVVGGGEVRGVDWKFNAWGGESNGLYASWAKDDAFAAFVCAKLGLPRTDARPFVCEGGSVHSDGEGTLKKYIQRGNSVILHPFNPAYEELVIKGEELDHLYIAGKVVETKAKW